MSRTAALWLKETGCMTTSTGLCQCKLGCEISVDQAVVDFV